MYQGMSEKARLAQSVERLALNQVVEGSSPSVGFYFQDHIVQYLRLLIITEIKDQNRQHGTTQYSKVTPLQFVEIGYINVCEYNERFDVEAFLIRETTQQLELTSAQWVQDSTQFSQKQSAPKITIKNLDKRNNIEQFHEKALSIKHHGVEQQLKRPIYAIKRGDQCKSLQYCQVADRSILRQANGKLKWKYGDLRSIRESKLGDIRESKFKEYNQTGITDSLQPHQHELATQLSQFTDLTPNNQALCLIIDTIVKYKPLAATSTASLFNQSLKLGIGQKSLDKINISPQTAESTQLRPLLIQTHESHRQSLRSNGSSQMVSPIQNNYLAYTQNNQLPLRNQQRKALKSQQNSILTSASKNANNNLLYQQQSPNNINNNNNNVNVFQRQMNTAASLAPLSVKSSHNAGNIHFNSTYTKSQNGMIKDVLPSEIDQDEWAEIARYQQEQDQEKKIKEQEAIMRRKQEVKAVLDAQLRERQKTIEMMTHEQKSFEVNLLKRLKDEETEDKKRQHERKLQIIQEKQKREQLLRQAQENKKQVFQKEMNSESEYLERLKLELEIEKQEQQNKRQKEMQEAQRIIKENQLIKMQKDKQRIVEKDEENKMLEQIKQLALDEERKRQELWEAREKKMEQAVNRMANTVVKKQEEQEKMIEQKVKKYEDEKEERDRNEEERRKEAMRMKNEQLKIALQEQLQQKILMKQEEQRQNEEYMRQWIGMGDQETKKIKSDERQRQIKLKENQIYLKDQIIGIKIQKNQPAVSKSPLRGAMNEEEIRLNRTLLLEISQKKKLQKTINTQQNQSISQGGDGISTHNFNGSGAQINTNFSQQ
eukprot:403351895